MAWQWHELSPVNKKNACYDFLLMVNLIIQLNKALIICSQYLTTYIKSGHNKKKTLYISSQKQTAAIKEAYTLLYAYGCNF